MIFFSVFVIMGPNVSKHFQTLLLYKLQAKVFKPFLNFPPDGPPVCFRVFVIWT